MSIININSLNYLSIISVYYFKIEFQKWLFQKNIQLKSFYDIFDDAYCK
ncbi:hypothetical protein RG47T_1749 [Mucilaginibacter polytrichastri]|uniref:Uncharacterized protein n=1 Tax=Mucilaginibacter polytrichastri TaxID=1302689 RepID=A0A1Q5ZX22_9SPHI|nr:hypothetical protein RG47T_1749 [Mucilaginibacter polytrichastri]